MNQLKNINGCDVDTLGRRVFNFGRPNYDIAHSMNCKHNALNATLSRGKYPEGTTCYNLKMKGFENYFFGYLYGKTIYVLMQ